jgi:hypothetical protein
MCYRIIDLGTQESSYKGKPRRTHLIRVFWELPGELAKDGEPMVISKRYTLSLSGKSILRADIESWRAKALTDEEAEAFDILKLLGAPCSLTLAKSEDGQYLNIVAVSKLIKGTPFPDKTYNKLTSLVLVPGEFNQAVYESLSDNMKDQIAKSPEYQAIKTGKPIQAAAAGGHVATDDFDDEIPF